MTESGRVDLLAQMATFVRVVDAGGYSAAASGLGLSVAAISRQVSSLEASVGGPLVIRTTRRFTVSEAGRRYYEHCQRVLREVEAAQASVKRANVVEGLLVVTVPVTYGLARVSPHVPALLAAHPGLSIDLRIEDRVVDLVRDGVDVAIRTGTSISDSPSLVARRLTSYRRVVVASPPYLKRRGTPRDPRALAKHAAILHVAMSGRVNRWTFVKGGEAVEVQVDGAVGSNAPYALRDAAVAGLGVAILPDWLVAAEVAAGQLKILLTDWEVPPVIVTGVFRTEMRGAPRIRALLDHLARAYAADRPASRPRRVA